MKKLVESVCASLFLLASLLTTVEAQNSPSLVIHNILVTPQLEKASYEVKVYLSVLDSSGISVKDLKPQDFSVIEDSQPMAVKTVEPANEPINLVMVLDTSGSMAGPAISSAKDAANNFLLGLDAEDQVAVLSFDTTVSTVTDFTKDRQYAGRQIASIEARPGAGTCLYDAAYQAVQSIASLPPGRRAVILFTDGVDEVISGKPCSTHKIEDVIQIATGGNSTIPIYTLGLGNRVDQQSLQRLASMTGGWFQYAPSSNQLLTIFKNLSDQLKSQYLLTYLTTSAQGNHTVVIQATTPGGNVKDTRNFISPAMPARILIKSPTGGQSISGKQTISAVITGQTEDVQRVVFYVGGLEVGQVSTAPYDFTFDFSTFAEENTVLEVAAQNSTGEIIAKQSITVNVTPPGANGGSSDIGDSASGAKKPGIISRLQDIPTGYLLGGGAGLFLIVVMITFLLVRGSKRKSSAGLPAVGILEVISSDDAMLMGKKFEITQPITRLGRLIADNDIAFPSDKPVSKHHAILEKKGGALYIREAPQGTTYGTFIGDQKIGNQQVLLRDGDEVCLGKRLKLKVWFSMGAGEKTSDNLAILEDKTLDDIQYTKRRLDPNQTQDPSD